MSSWLGFWRSSAAPVESFDDGKMLDVDRELDISEVYPRILVVGMPYKGVTSRGSHKNNIDELSAHLAERYGPTNYVVWNLTTEDRCTVDERKFRDQVLKFPPVLSEADVAQLDDGLPLIGEIFHICYSLKFWLDLSPAHVAVLHEDRGKTRAPFLAACFLAWEHSHLFVDPVMALDRVGAAREVPHVWPKSWKRTLLTLHQLCNTPHPVPARRLHLSTIIVYMTGTIRNHKGGVRIQVFCGRRLAWDSDADSDRYKPESAASGSGAHREADYQYDEGLLKVRIDDVVEGDVQIHVSAELPMVVLPQVVPTPSGDLPDMSCMEGYLEQRTVRRTLVRYAFHTNTLPADAIQVPVDHVDVPRLNRKYVLANPAADPATGLGGGKQDFWMQLVLSEPDARAEVNQSHSQSQSQSGSLAQYLLQRVPPPEGEGGRSNGSLIVSTLGEDGVSGPLVQDRSGPPQDRSLGPPSAAEREAMASETQFVHFTEWMNLRGRAAQLQGLFWFSDAHHVMPEQGLVYQLHREFGLPHALFAAAAIQIGQRDMSASRSVLRLDLMQQLSRPRRAGDGSAVRATLMELQDALNDIDGGNVSGRTHVHAPASLRASTHVGGTQGTPAPSDAIIPVIATTLAAMLMVGSQGTGAKSGDGGWGQGLGDLQDEHERISTFLRDGLAHMMLDDEPECVDAEGAVERTIAGVDERLGGRPQVESELGNEGAGIGAGIGEGTGEKASDPHTPQSCMGAVKERDGGVGKEGNKEGRPLMRDLLGLQPRVHLLAGGGGPNSSTGTPRTPSALRPLVSVLDTLYASPDPALYLAGLQLAAAVRTADRRGCVVCSDGFGGTLSGAGKHTLLASPVAFRQPGFRSALANPTGPVPTFVPSSTTDMEWLSALDPFILRRLLSALQALNATSMDLTGMGQGGVKDRVGEEVVGGGDPSMHALDFLALLALPGAAQAEAKSAAAMEGAHGIGAGGVGGGWLPSVLGGAVTGLVDGVGGMLFGSGGGGKSHGSGSGAALPADWDEDDKLQVRRAHAVSSLASLLDAHPHLEALFVSLGPELAARSGTPASPLRIRQALNSTGSSMGEGGGADEGCRKGVGVSTPLPAARSLTDFLGGRAGQAEGARCDPVPGPAPAAAPEACAEAAVDVTSPALSKFVRMLKMGVPPAAVEAKMKGTGCSGEEVEAGLATVGAKPALPAVAPPPLPPPAHEGRAEEGGQEEPVSAADRVSTLRAEQAAVAAEALLPLADHPVWSQFFKMVRMGLPAGAVHQKMTVAGLDPAVLGYDPTAPHPVGPPALRDSTRYGKYFKMLKMGLPAAAVAHKMSSEGVDPIALECDPGLPEPPSLSAPTASPRKRAAAEPPAPPKPRRLRKKLHWDTLSADRVKGRGGETIWSTAPGAGGEGNEVAGGGEGEDEDIFDGEELEALFTSMAGPIGTDGSGGAGKGGKQGATTGAGGVVALLDMKRGRAVGIGLAKLRLSPALLRSVLMDLTAVLPTGMLPEGYTGSGVLSLEQLMVLEDILPSHEEVALVKGYRGDRSRLGEAEAFFAAMADVPKAKSRAAALAFQHAFSGRVADVDSRVRLLAAACAEVRRSRRLKRVLEAVLKLGNKLNSDDGGGSSAAGFTLASLNKLAITKSFNGKMTLLQYFASTLYKKDGPDSLDLAFELPSIGPAGRVELKGLRDDISGLRRDLGNVERLVREHARVLSQGSQGQGQPALSAASTGGAGVGLVSPTPFRPTLEGFSPPNQEAMHVTAPQPGLAAVHMDGGAPAGGGATVRVEPEQEEFVPHMASTSQVAEQAHAGADAIEVNAPVTASASAEEPLDIILVEVEDTSLQAFVAKAQTRVSALGGLADAAALDYTSLLAFFGEDDGMSVESFFSTLAAFARSLSKAKQELIEEGARIAREGRAREKEQSRLERAQLAPNAGHPTPASAPAPAVALRTYRGPAMLDRPEPEEGSTGGETDSLDPRLRLEALFKSKSAFFVRTGGVSAGPGEVRPTTGRKDRAAAAPFAPAMPFSFGLDGGSTCATSPGTSLGEPPGEGGQHVPLAAVPVEARDLEL